MKKISGYRLTGGRVSRQCQRVRVGETFLIFLDILSRHFEKFLHTLKLKLAEQNYDNYDEIMIFRTFTAKF